MLDACSKAGDPQSAESWLQRMLDGGLQPNVISFATVIHACARKGDETRAQYWQSKMLEMGVEPAARLKFFFLLIFGKASRARAAVDLCSEIERSPSA